MSDHIYRAVRQQLESLQRAGVQQLCHVELCQLAQAESPPAALETTTAGPQPPSAADSPRTETNAKQVGQSMPLTDAMKGVDVPRLSRSEKSLRLDQLSKQICLCTKCPELVANRSQTVFGVGNPSTRLCFFGEAPGADEDRQGEPFVGRAGQLLDNIIEACTLKREDVYILNVAKCRPPGNRNPTPEEAENCRPFFEQQLEIIRPEFICCLGAVAAHALLQQKTSIGKMRGMLHSWRWAKVLVTYHPAYLLRNPPAKRDVWNDMQFLMKEMGIELK